MKGFSSREKGSWNCHNQDNVLEILPSLLAADFARLGEQIAQVEAAGATHLHLDVMDGRFVPNLSFGPPVVRSLRRISKSFFDVHLMVADPDSLIPAFADAGADQLLVHQETCPHLDRTLRHIRSLSLGAGVVINPATPVSTLTEVLPIVDLVLVMSVNPGFGGQAFLAQTLRKTRQLDQLRRDHGYTYRIEMDGGIDATTAPDCVRAGCDWLVAGTSVFGNPDPGAAVRSLSALARSALAVRA